VENFEEKYESWNVAYHGTSFDARFGIAALGLLLPGKITTDGRIILVRTGQIGSTKDSPSIYCSPSIHYASAFAELKPTIEDKYIQIAFQVRVEPTSYRTIQNTLGNQKWPENLPFDPKWPQDSIAWLVSDATKIKVYGLLYRDTTVEHPSFSITRQLSVKKELDSRKNSVTNNITWEYLFGADTNGNKLWSPYSANINKVIDEDYLNGKSKSRIIDANNGLHYEIYFGVFAQRQCEDKTKRRSVRRIMQLN